MIRNFLLLLVFTSSLFAQFRLKRVTFLQEGLVGTVAGRVICCDSDHDGLQEMIFRTGTIHPTDPLRWEVWEYRPVNRYELVFADTGAYPYPPGITTGNFRPCDVGDIDQDGLTDLVGVNEENPQNPDTFYNLIVTQESPDYFSYPESLSWWYRYDHNSPNMEPVYFTSDLDNDGRNEVLKLTHNPQIGTGIWENLGNNQNVLVWSRLRVGAWNFAFGDFDLDGRKEFVTADLGGGGWVSVYENTGDDQYEMVYRDTVHLPNGGDVFSGNDLDQDGRPEFFVGFYVVPTNTFYLYMWEATGNNTYERTFIDQKTMATTGNYALSKCGDLDGDGVEELVWATPLAVYVYKAVGNNLFQEVWHWRGDHGHHESLIVNIHDMNNGGYNDLVVGGSRKTSVFEVEALRVLYPNGGENLVPGDTCWIRWETFNPPRCDSVSLFLRSDTSWQLDTIVTGLSPTDTVYPWIVPPGPHDSCRIVAIAYGPGWQYDESDSAFQIPGIGIRETHPLQVYATRLDVYPNPGRGRMTVRYEVASAGPVEITAYDPIGRKVAVLASGSCIPGRYRVNWNCMNEPAGVYFLRMDCGKQSRMEKVILTSGQK